MGTYIAAKFTFFHIEKKQSEAITIQIAKRLAKINFWCEFRKIGANHFPTTYWFSSKLEFHSRSLREETDPHLTQWSACVALTVLCRASKKTNDIVFKPILLAICGIWPPPIFVLASLWLPIWPTWVGTLLGNLNVSHFVPQYRVNLSVFAPGVFFLNPLI